MDLHDFAQPIQTPDGIIRVIEDQHLLNWAAAVSIQPWEAQQRALEKKLLPERYLKNLNALTLSEQEQICSSSVLVCGCGGLGGVILSLLARLGVGHLRMIDGDRFAASNLNRQWFCDVTRLNEPKATVAAQQLKRINPLIEIKAHDFILSRANALELLEGVDLVMDAVDNIEARFILADTAQRHRIPFIHGAVAGWWGQISTFVPHSPVNLEHIYGERRSRDPAEQAMGVLGATASVIASLQVLEATRILSGKKPAYAGKLVYFDGETGTLQGMPLLPESDQP